LLVVSLAEV